MGRALAARRPNRCYLSTLNDFTRTRRGLKVILDSPIDQVPGQDTDVEAIYDMDVDDRPIEDNMVGAVNPTAG